MIETSGKSILFDPFISPNPLASSIDVNTISPDYMLLSHGHEDHIADAPAIAQRSNCTVVAIWELAAWMVDKGATHTHGMNIGGTWNFDFGRVKMVQAIHSSTLPDGNSAGNAAGFVVQNEVDCFYYAGDTALYSDMALIPKRFKLKTAFLPIGSNFTMDIEDAIDAAKILGVTHVIGMHYDTFGFIVINHEDAIAAFANAGITLELMKIGSTITI